eukprot:7642812-Pyramimonas_sp.AAC.1
MGAVFPRRRAQREGGIGLAGARRAPTRSPGDDLGANPRFWALRFRRGSDDEAPVHERMSRHSAALALR